MGRRRSQDYVATVSCRYWENGPGVVGLDIVRSQTYAGYVVSQRHSLHTHASLLLHTGATPKVVEEQLRHADRRVTVGMYSHLIGEDRRNAVERVASDVAPKSEGKRSRFNVSWSERWESNPCSEFGQATSRRVHCGPLRIPLRAVQWSGYVRQRSEHIDLLEEMKRRKLQDGWDEIFLEPWALHEDIERVRAWLRCHLRDRRFLEIESASSEGKSF
jgi:hypothetical protein